MALSRTCASTGDSDFPPDDFAHVRAPALGWKVPDPSFADTTPANDTQAETTCTAQKSTLVSNRIMSGSLKGSYSFVSAATEATRNERLARVAAYKTMFVTAKGWYRKASLDLTLCCAVLHLSSSSPTSRPTGRPGYSGDRSRLFR